MDCIRDAHQRAMRIHATRVIQMDACVRMHGFSTHALHDAVDLTPSDKESVRYQIEDP